jgi:hypothetical protein
MRKLILLFIALVILFSGCTNNSKFRGRNRAKGSAVVSNFQNTETLFVDNAAPVITIQRPDY